MEIGSTLCRTVRLSLVVWKMPSAFSTRACNDWSLEWQGVKDERWETVLCFASGEGLDRLAVEHVCYSHTWTTFCLINQVVFLVPRWTEEEKLSGAAATFPEKRTDVGPLGEEPESAGDLTWFLVCCCALSLLLGCRGVSLGMGPIGVGCRGDASTRRLWASTFREE